MALTIATIPVLTGEAAEKFEAQAHQTYQHYLQKGSETKQNSQHYANGIKMVRDILAKSQLAVL